MNMRLFFWRRTVLFCVILSSFAFDLGLARADEPKPLEIHEMSFWATEPTATQVNAVAGYPSAMPGAVDSLRSRVAETGRPDIQPLSLMFFSGGAPKVADLSLRIPAGRFLATWPMAENKNNRVAWKDLKFADASAGSELFAFVPEGHWFERARKIDSLPLERGARIEKFIAYDPELNAQFSLRLEGEANKYRIFNGSKYALKDVLFLIPDKDGTRLCWLDELASNQPNKPAGKAATPPPAPKNDAEKAGRAVAEAIVKATGAVAQQVASAVPATTPVTAETSADIELSGPLNAVELKRQGVDELKKRLTTAGLTDSETDLLLSLYSKAIFESKEPVLLFRVPQATIEELLPLEIDPENTKIVRVALMVCLKVDPRIRDELKKLIAQLNDDDFAQREQAEQRLYALGRMALPALKEAAKSKEPEQAMRAERLLLEQKEKLDGK
jgi:hypothetical protein